MYQNCPHMDLEVAESLESRIVNIPSSAAPNATAGEQTCPTKICVVTGTRAEYGLLLPLLQALKVDPAFELQLVATAAHLSPEFGLTYRIIEEDGFAIDAKVEMLLSSRYPRRNCKVDRIGNNRVC